MGYKVSKERRGVGYRVSVQSTEGAEGGGIQGVSVQSTEGSGGGWDTGSVRAVDRGSGGGWDTGSVLAVDRGRVPKTNRQSRGSVWMQAGGRLPHFQNCDTLIS